MCAGVEHASEGLRDRRELLALHGDDDEVLRPELRWIAYTPYPRLDARVAGQHDEPALADRV